MKTRFSDLSLSDRRRFECRRLARTNATEIAGRLGAPPVHGFPRTEAQPKS